MLFYYKLEYIILLENVDPVILCIKIQTIFFFFLVSLHVHYLCSELNIRKWRFGTEAWKNWQTQNKSDKKNQPQDLSAVTKKTEALPKSRIH